MYAFFDWWLQSLYASYKFDATKMFTETFSYYWRYLKKVLFFIGTIYLYTNSATVRKIWTDRTISSRIYYFFNTLRRRD